MDQLISAVLHDRYRIRSLLGRQTGRRVFLATDLQTKLSVVIKLLLFNPDFTWDDLKLFEREAEVLKSLVHPAIPKYLDYFEVEIKLRKGFALVQTYIEARSLQDWIQSGRTFSEKELKAIAKDLINILAYLHNRQPPVVHRDIKPSNVLLGDRSGNSPGQVYLVDFGSVQTAVHGGTRTVVGTYGYMPPEQFGGQSVPASDLYALGATLIYLATGHHPDHFPQREMRILFEDSVNLSPNFIDWLKWMTEPSTDLRLKSAKQTLEALEKSSLRRSLAIVSKPINSKIKITKTRQMLEFLIPPQNSYCDLIVLLVGVMMLLSGSAGLFDGAFRGWNANWLASLFLFSLGIPFVLGGSVLLVGILCMLARQRLHVTQQTISLTYEFFGVRFLPARTVDRKMITKVEYIYLEYKPDSLGNTTAVPPHINIWAGTKKLSIGNDGEGFNGKGRLNDPELDWLALELSDWLNTYS
jgi:serine/threonine protein kinase